MDSIRVSEAPDTGSIPVEATVKFYNLWQYLLSGIFYLLRDVLVYRLFTTVRAWRTGGMFN